MSHIAHRGCDTCFRKKYFKLPCLCLAYQLQPPLCSSLCSLRFPRSQHVILKCIDVKQQRYVARVRWQYMKIRHFLELYLIVVFVIIFIFQDQYLYFSWWTKQVEKWFNLWLSQEALFSQPPCLFVQKGECCYNTIQQYNTALINVLTQDEFALDVRAKGSCVKRRTIKKIIISIKIIASSKL